jgi:very-short-patch-repair endonuclease
MYRDQNQREFARHLRNNLTDAERRLWKLLRCQQLKGFKFRRQAAIEHYIVDFVCFSKKLVVELVGGQHNEATARDYDQARTQWLESRGFRVLRFWNHDVFENEDDVVDAIWKSLTQLQLALSSAPPPTPPPPGRAPARCKTT